MVRLPFSFRCLKVHLIWALDHAILTTRFSAEILCARGRPSHRYSIHQTTLDNLGGNLKVLRSLSIIENLRAWVISGSRKMLLSKSLLVFRGLPGLKLIIISPHLLNLIWKQPTAFLAFLNALKNGAVWHILFIYSNNIGFFVKLRLKTRALNYQIITFYLQQ